MPVTTMHPLSVVLDVQTWEEVVDPKTNHSCFHARFDDYHVVSNASVSDALCLLKSQMYYSGKLAIKD